MDQFPFPLSFLFKQCIKCRTTDGEVCLEQDMGNTTQRLLLCPPIELLRSLIPGECTTNRVTNENSIVSLINQRCLQTNMLCKLETLPLSETLLGDIANSQQVVGSDI